MRWKGRRASTRVEDRRGGGRPAARKAGGLGLGGVILVLIFAYLTDQNPLQLLGMIEGGSSPSGSVSNVPTGPSSAPGDELGQFAAVVLADTEETWTSLLGQGYRLPSLVLFSDEVRSACGFNSAAVGPFYCPADQKIYIDLTFFHTLERQLGAPGDFAQAYVLAHEVGHHVQNLMGISGKVHDLERRSSEVEANRLSVRLELQADCLAGVWAHYAHTQRQLLEPGDIEEGLRAAAAIGDDTLQKRSSGRVRPESWTHGSSEQRQTWLARGLESGDVNACDTFGSGN